MSFYNRDANYVPGTIRAGNGIGGYLLLGDTLTVNQWYRLMPNSNTGALVAGDDRKLNIGALRSDVLEIEGWNLVLLNAGYQHQYIILNHDRAATEVELTLPINYADGMRAGGLGSAIEFVMYPELLNPLGVNYSVGATDHIDIGVAREDLFVPTVLKRDEIPPGELLMMNFERIDRIFYRFPAITTAAENNLGWGEHYKG